ncbi:MAG: galactosyltransferase-related protein [Phycisphaerales bacterium]
MTIPPDIHLIIPTHTTRHLEAVLIGVARQSRKPTTLTVTADVVDDEIDGLLESCAEHYGLEIRYVRREHQGVARISQVRNNAVRSLIGAGHESGRLLILDGDTFPPAATVENHATLGGDHGLVVASRVMMSEARTNAINLDELRTGAERLEPTESDRSTLEREHRRASWHQKLRRLGLAKSHKPKIVGGHFSIRFDLYLEINGCDEEYEGYGQEDDDLGRRAYQAGADSIVAIRQIPVMHLYHPTRAPIPWNEFPGYERFRRTDLPVRCRHGVENPVAQSKLRESILKGPSAGASVAPVNSEASRAR